MSRRFFVNLVERAVKTFAQALLGLGLFSGTGVISAGWKQVLLTAGTMAVFSIVTSVASSRIGDPDDPAVLSDGAMESVHS